MSTHRAEPLALVVDPDDSSATRIERLLRGLRFEVVRVPSGCAALGELHSLAPRIAVVSEDVSDLAVDQLVRQLREAAQTPILVLTTAAHAVTAPRLDKTTTLEKTAPDAAMQRAIESLIARDVSGSRAPLSACDLERSEFLRLYSGLFHRSAKMRAVERLALQAGASDAPVIIRGESGVGKTCVARAVHYFSDRSAGPWVTTACYGLPPEVLAAELPQRFALAHHGTLVLEDIDQLPPDTQAAVQRILRDRETVDVRLIATASRDLEPLVGAGVFRKDLYYALNVLALTVPPLRDRAEEIPGLAEFFRATFMERYRRDTGHLSNELTTTFVGYHWPGNVRELEGVVKRYVVLGGEQDIREELRTRARTITAGACLLASPGEIGLSLKQIGQRAAQRAEKAAMLSTLERVNWNRAEAARCLKISYKTLLNKLNQSPAAPGRHQRKS